MPKTPQPENPVDMSVRLPAALARRVFAHGERIRVTNRSAILQAIIAEGLDAIEAKLPKSKRDATAAA